MGQARIYVTLGRQRLLPPWLAKVSDYTGKCWSYPRVPCYSNPHYFLAAVTFITLEC